MTLEERLEKRLVEVRKLRESAVMTTAQCDAVIAELTILLAPELPETKKEPDAS